MKKQLLFIFLMCTFSSFCQEYAVRNIPENLKKNAYAVVRSERTVLELKDYDEVIEKFHSVITVLNRSGLSSVSPIVYYKESSGSIKKIEAKIYNKNGIEIKKFKKKDFLEASASGSTLYSDNRVLSLDYIVPSFPFTFEFEYELKSKTTGFLLPFVPARYTNLSVETASFELINEKQIPLQLKESKLEAYGVKKTTTATSVSYVLEQMEPLQKEYALPHYTDYLPYVKIAPQRFMLEGVEADIKNWKDFGLWQNEYLLKNKDEISDETKARVTEITKNISDEREKIKAIYEFMQNKTRYINVQVGIGGWQPSPASEVDELGYGDCKGLTIYTKALLKSQGIDSYYTLVDSQEDGQDIDEDFVALQGDHVILTVPLDDEQLFLECTSQQLPFNYLGTHTDDRKVLMITPEGGVMTKTHTYTEKDNVREFNAEILIDENLVMRGSVSEKSYGLRYGSSYGLETLKKEELETYYKEHYSHINNLKIENVQFENNKEAVIFTEKYKFQGSNYIAKAGDRLLLIPNVFNRFDYVPNTTGVRKQEIDIRRGATLKDSIKILLPAGYHVESVFETIEMNNEFGSYKATITSIDASTLLYTREVVLLAGRFPKESFKTYDGFIKSLVKSDKSKIVLVKN